MNETCLVLGGTKGLGRAIAIESLRRGIQPTVVGRSAAQAKNDPALIGARFTVADLADPFPLLAEHLAATDITKVFWVAGAFDRRAFDEVDRTTMEHLVRLHLIGPLVFLQAWHRARRTAGCQPYHLIVIASTSSWRIRDREALYCSLKAAKAHLTRNLAAEITRDLPGSQVVLINPGGMKTENFWAASGQDIATYMEPAAVASVIWDIVAKQETGFMEYQIMRRDSGAPEIIVGPVAPELPL